MIRSHKILVKTGTLNIGSVETPWEDKAIIELLGDNISGYWSLVSDGEAGNKNLVITGTVNMIAKGPDFPTSRL